MKRISIVVLLCYVALALNGCVSIVPAAHYTDLDFSAMEPGIEIEVYGGDALLASATTPARIELRNAENVYIIFKKAGYHPQAVQTILGYNYTKEYISCLTSIPTIGFTYMIDSATDATKEIYPNRFEFKLVPMDENVGHLIEYDFFYSSDDRISRLVAFR